MKKDFLRTAFLLALLIAVMMAIPGAIPAASAKEPPKRKKFNCCLYKMHSTLNSTIIS